jgi:hypothetical protein
MKVFLVSSGEYSDRRTVGIFSTRENAEAEKRLWPSANDIEEWVLDACRNHPEDCQYYAVGMSAAGAAVFIDQMDPADHPDRDGPETLPDWPRFIFHVWARDRLHAVKIAGDRRRQRLALPPSEILR